MTHGTKTRSVSTSLIQNIDRSFNYKTVETAMFVLNSVSSVVLYKSHDTLEIGIWVYTLNLVENNRRTTICTKYRPCKGCLNAMGDSIATKQ